MNAYHMPNESIVVCMSTSNTNWRDAKGDLLPKICSSPTCSLKDLFLLNIFWLIRLK